MSSGTVPTDYRFTGQRSESGLGLVHMGARFYDSYIARWLSADTIVPDFTNPQSLNRYSYTYNRPLNLTDPSGHCPPEDQSCKPHMEDESPWGWSPQPTLPPTIVLPGSMVVETVEDLQQEPPTMLLTRLVFGEARGGPPIRWRATAASVIVRAEENYLGRGGSIHAQALSPGAYHVFNYATGFDPEPNDNMRKTMDPTLENGGGQVFKEIYRDVTAM